MKRKLITSLVLALILVLLTAAAGAAPLTVREIIEQTAVPLAVANDTGAVVQDLYTPEQLAELAGVLNENGFILQENNIIMQMVQNGLGYYEEETMMEICRQAFGGNISTWTLEEQDWFDRQLADIGFYEAHEPRLPGEGNMTYEEAEAFAFTFMTQQFGEEVDPENRDKYRLCREFYRDAENENVFIWAFELEPKDIAYGDYYVSFEDQDPEGTAYCYAAVPDWTGAYACDEVEMAFDRAYGWSMGQWPQSIWQKYHEMMAGTEINPDDFMYPQYRGYQLTAYPEPEADEISREDAIQAAKEALQKDRAALDSAVLTEYEGERAWMVGMIIRRPEDEPGPEIYVVTVDSRTGEIKSLRESTQDDDASMPFVAEAAYEKAREGRLKGSEYIRIAAEAIRQKYPELDVLDENEFEISDQGGIAVRTIRFITKNTQHGNAVAWISPDGTVVEAEADIEAPDGDNIMERYWAVYGYFGLWDQETWFRLGKDVQDLRADSIEGQLLKVGNYPKESSVRIGHEEAQTLAVQASGKKAIEVNTCVLIDAEPHPVWKMRLISYDPEDQVIEIDAETGEVTAVDVYKTDYTPNYHVYSLEKNWRKLEMETFGPVYMAKEAVTYSYGDLWQDYPELNLDDPDEYEIRADGLIIRFIGRWAGMKSYTVELDEGGYVLRCEETDSDSTEERPEELPDPFGENG